MKKILLMSILFSAFLGCKQEKKIERIEINPFNFSVEKYEYIQLTAKVLYNDNSFDTTATVNWQSGDTNIAKINSKGLLKGIDTGSVVISVSLGNISDQVDASVIQNKLFKRNWKLDSIQNIGTNQIIIFPDSISREVEIYFSYGRIFSTDTFNSAPMVGFSGICNSGGGYCYIDGKKISIPRIMSTRIDCKNVEWEEYLIDNLKSAYEYYLNANQLLIKSKGTYNLFFKEIQ